MLYELAVGAALVLVAAVAVAWYFDEPFDVL